MKGAVAPCLMEMVKGALFPGVDTHTHTHTQQHTPKELYESQSPTVSPPFRTPGDIVQKKGSHILI